VPQNPTARGPSKAEQAAYLHRILLPTPTPVADLVGRVLDLGDPCACGARPSGGIYMNLALVELALAAPGLLERALRKVAEIGCLACTHPRHQPGECLVGLAPAEGEDARYCICGVVDAYAAEFGL